MKEKLKILIANDDGIRSEGIAKLARAAASFGTVWVAALVFVRISVKT